MLLSRLLFVFVASYAFALESDKLCAIIKAKKQVVERVVPFPVNQIIHPIALVKPFACIVCSTGFQTANNEHCDNALQYLIPFGNSGQPSLKDLIDNLLKLHDCVKATYPSLSSPPDSSGCKLYS
jgi:hypothetical protein